MSDSSKTGSLIVLSGPSGTGKSTVIAQVLERRNGIYFSVSFTTRQPRAGEQDGVNYNYVSTAEFERMIAAGELLEYAQYVDNYYGTSLKLIRDNLEAGRDVLLDIEVQGASIVREKCPEAVLIFIAPPSFEELSKRLHGRGTDSEEIIQNRLEQAKRELRCAPNYDYLVINDEVTRAADEICTILAAAGCRVANRLNYLEGVN